MTDKEYEQKRRECWEEFKNAVFNGDTSHSPYGAFVFAFDRAYVLGKQETKQEIKQETDAEVEEMLAVSRKEIQEIYRDADNLRRDPAIPSHSTYWNAQVELLQDLFGSKCLPDEDLPIEATSAQTATSPTFKAGNKVCCISPEYKGVYKVYRYIENGCYSCVDSDGYYFVFHESNLEPYTEPVENHIAGERKMVDNIIKDGFSKERRLNIAAMMAQGIMANSNPQMVELNVEKVVDLAILTADALIAESDKGDESADPK